MDPLKNAPVGITGLQRLKTLPFVSSLIKDNVEALHFHIKSSGVQGLVLVQIMFQNCTTNFYLESDKVSIKTIKTATANLWTFLGWRVYTFL